MTKGPGSDDLADASSRTRRTFDQDVVRLTAALERDGIGRPTIADYAWPGAALNVLDCVLSLNRRYRRFCWPRVQRFAVANPAVSSLEQLRQLIARYESPLEFGREQLNVSHADRMRIVVDVIHYLQQIRKKYPVLSELAALRAWAKGAAPSDSESVGIPGFALAGFQYLRMLFGAQTLKPDVHTIGFVKSSLHRPVNPRDALRLLEVSAGRKGWRLRDLDFAIWERFARDSRHIAEDDKPLVSVSRSIMPFHVSELLGESFAGFDTVASIRTNRVMSVPAKPGVYVILRPLMFPPIFRKKNPAGHFKGRDPTVPIAILREAWVDGAFVLYIGNAGGVDVRSMLRSRLQCYLDYGAGRAVAHQGGRYVWQLERSNELLVAWCEANTGNPAHIESRMIDHFTNHDQLPFANLRR